jgi:hypothetical protein
MASQPREGHPHVENYTLPESPSTAGTYAGPSPLVVWKRSWRKGLSCPDFANCPEYVFQPMHKNKTATRINIFNSQLATAKCNTDQLATVVWEDERGKERSGALCRLREETLGPKGRGGAAPGKSVGWSSPARRAPLIGKRPLAGLRALNSGHHPKFFFWKFISPPLTIFGKL